MWNQNRHNRGRGGFGSQFRNNNNRHHNNNNNSNVSQPKAVGTEALAKANQQRNARDFRYPSTGFVTPVEYTLLYSMLTVPNIYPPDVMLDMIREQHFHEFLRVKPPKQSSSATTSSTAIDEPIYSYGQLSALLYLTAERWPSPPPPPEQQQQQQDFKNNDTDAAWEAAQRDKNNYNQSVPQTLCRAVLQTVVRHAERHNLDRESEVRELLEPLQLLNAKKVNKVNLALLAPMYIGLGASIVTGAAVPLWIGYMVAGALATNQAPSQTEVTNFGHVADASRRMADEASTSLLDNMEDASSEHYDDDDYDDEYQ